MKIIRTIKRMQQWSGLQKVKKKSIGFVPTMGALHEGHRSLVRRCIRENDVTVVSIFINPIQFGPREDFLKYPRPFAKDAALLRREGVDVIFSPYAQQMYASDFSVYVEETQLSRDLCGMERPGHFRGVVTVVCKLFNAVHPDKAYFGEKDYQQLKVIQRLVRDLSYPLTIVPCPIIRDHDGLALSSRNTCLTIDERQKALMVYKTLQKSSEMIQSFLNIKAIYALIKKDWKNLKNCRLEYFKCVEPGTLVEKKTNKGPIRVMIAAWIGKTRIIDNILVGRRS